MNLNFKLYFKYILLNTDYLFLKYLVRNDKNLIIFTSQNNLYYLTLHLKLSTLFYSLQLSDIFCYEIPTNQNYVTSKTDVTYKTPLLHHSLVVYNFHSILFQQRFFIFVSNNFKQNINKNSLRTDSHYTISELFLNANWLERENAELHGIFFAGKKDLRNLMLQYGDTSTPMLKSFPTVGTREIFYDSVTDLLIQNPVTLQF